MMKDLHLLTNFHFHLNWCHSYFYLLAQPLLLTFCHCGQPERQTWWIFQALKTLVLSNHCVGMCSVLMPAHKSSSQLLCSQLKRLQWASGECTPNVLQAFGAELKPVFFSSFFLYPQYFSQQTIYSPWKVSRQFICLPSPWLWPQQSNLFTRCSNIRWYTIKLSLAAKWSTALKIE